MKNLRWVLLFIIVFCTMQCTSIEQEVKDESDSHIDWIDSVLSNDTLMIKDESNDTLMIKDESDSHMDWIDSVLSNDTLMIKD